MLSGGAAAPVDGGQSPIPDAVLKLTPDANYFISDEFLFGVSDCLDLRALNSYIYGSRVYVPIVNEYLSEEVAKSDLDIAINVSDLSTLKHKDLALLGNRLASLMNGEVKAGYKLRSDKIICMDIKGDITNIEFDFFSENEGFPEVGIKLCNNELYETRPLSSLDEIRINSDSGLHQEGDLSSPTIYWKNVFAATDGIDIPKATKNFARLFISLARSGLFPGYLDSKKVVESLAKELEGSPNSKVMFNAVHSDPQSIIDTVNDKKPDLAKKITVETVGNFFNVFSKVATPVTAIGDGIPKSSVEQVKAVDLDPEEVRSP